MKGLSNHEQLIILNVLQSFPAVEKAILFGSRALETHTIRSDIDLALEGTALSNQVLGTIKTAFDESDLVVPVDLQNYHSISNENLKDHIMRVGIQIYSKR